MTSTSSSTGRGPVVAVDGRPLRRRGWCAHVDGTTTRGPTRQCRAPVTWTRPSESSKSPGVTGTRRCVPPAPITFDGVPAAGQREQRVDRHGQRIRTVSVVIATSTGAWSRVPVAARIGGRDVHLDRAVSRSEPDPGVATLLDRTHHDRAWSRWSGSVIVTRSPTFTCDCCAASSATVTCRATDSPSVPARRAWPPSRRRRRWSPAAAVGRNTDLPQIEPAGLCHPEMGLQLLDRGLRRPAELVRGRVEIRPARVTERHQSRR